MTVKFIEPGGDADFGFGLWPGTFGSPTIVSDFVHGGHQRSVRFTVGGGLIGSLLVADAGARISFYLYIVAYPTSNSIIRVNNSGTASFNLNLSSTGALSLNNGAGTALCAPTASPNLALNSWYRVSFAYTVTSTTVNEFRLFIDGKLVGTGTNKTVSTTGINSFYLGNVNGTANMDIRVSDVYVDDSTALTDTGDMWVTAKRPNANGTANNFTTQIGSGGSGYGTGHSPQVNERPSSDTNGWSVAAVAATTEEYNIESKSTGDIDITKATIQSVMGWVRVKSLIAETAQIVLDSATSNIASTTTITTFKKVGGSSYPAGSGTDIGVVSSATVTTISLYECGVVVAYTPPPPAGFFLAATR